ncbi:MAG TPA: hypothetical protein VH834_14305 [Solirubrobacteraceae bacterium]|jgi:hypothetical protein
MTSELVFLALIHLVALVAGCGLLLLALLTDSNEPRGPDGGGGGGGASAPPPRPVPRAPVGPPLPDAAPARVRLRGPTRLADLLPGRPRRQHQRPRRVPARSDEV